MRLHKRFVSNRKIGSCIGSCIANLTPPTDVKSVAITLNAISCFLLDNENDLFPYCDIIIAS